MCDNMTTTDPFGPRVIEFDGMFRFSPQFFRVCTGNGATGEGFAWLSVKRGWLPATRDNVRYYTDFATRDSAERAIARVK